MLQWLRKLVWIALGYAGELPVTREDLQKFHDAHFRKVTQHFDSQLAHQQQNIERMLAQTEVRQLEFHGEQEQKRSLEMALAHRQQVAALVYAGDVDEALKIARIIESKSQDRGI